jgi:hypothetical protein
MVGVRCLLSLNSRSVAIDYGPLKTNFSLFGVNATNSENKTNPNNVR